MAWVDDRIWCHPKLAGLTARAFRAYVHGLAYSSGFSCHGNLTDGQIKTIGADAKARHELVEARLWEPVQGGIAIHDWDEHNGRRDAKRASDRERKRRQRARDTDRDVTRDEERDNPRDRRALTDDGSEGSEGKEEKPSSLPLDATDQAGRQEPENGYTPEELDSIAASLLKDIPA